MTFGVLIVTAWFFVAVAVLVWQYAGGAFTRIEQEREDAPALAAEPAALSVEPVFALASRYKRAKAPVCVRRRASAA